MLQRPRSRFQLGYDFQKLGFWMAAARKIRNRCGASNYSFIISGFVSEISESAPQNKRRCEDGMKYFENTLKHNCNSYQKHANSFENKDNLWKALKALNKHWKRIDNQSKRIDRPLNKSRNALKSIEEYWKALHPVGLPLRLAWSAGTTLSSTTAVQAVTVFFL